MRKPRVASSVYADANLSLKCVSHLAGTCFADIVRGKWLRVQSAESPSPIAAASSSSWRAMPARARHTRVVRCGHSDEIA